MTIDVNLGEFKSAYLAEVDELMALARAQLREAEDRISSASSPGRSIREMLRALHTVKGLSAMVSVEPIVEIAHPMETLLREADRGEIVITGASIELLEEGLREIESRVQQFATSRPVLAPPASLLARFDNRDSAAPRASVASSSNLDPTIAKKLARDEVERLQNPTAGERAVAVTFVPSPAKAEGGQTITSMRSRFGELGSLVRVLPIATPVSADAPGGLAFMMLGLTSASDLELRAALEDPQLPVETLATAPVPKMPSTAPIATVDDAGPRRSGHLRVDVKRVDVTVDELGGLLVSNARVERAVQALGARGADTRELTVLLEDQARQLRELRASVLSLRMVPIGEVLEPLGLVIRDLARRSHKPMRLHVEGGGAEVDKFVAEQLFSALVHLVRNAVDHGVESAEERRKAGKPEVAVIEIVCFARSNRQIELRVSDDGGGIDQSRVARLAGRAELDARGLLDAISTPGFSTRDVATTTSGRGMGMDIARRTVEGKLSGELELETRPGAGTTFVVRVPVTIAVVDAIKVRVRGEELVVALSTIEEIVDLDTSMISEPPGSSGASYRILLWRGRTISLVDLGAVLRIPARGPVTRARQALVVRRGSDLLAFAIERASGQKESLIRPMSDPLLLVPGVSGSTDLGEGRPTLVIDLVSLAARLFATERAA